MSFGRSLSVGIMGMFGGLLVNILTNPVSDFAERFGLPLIPTLLVALLAVVILSAILQTSPLRASSTPAQFQAQLLQHRTELHRLKDRCQSGKVWTASCVEVWQEHQRTIVAVKRACSDLGLLIRDDPIDSEPPPRLGCAVRLALLMKNAAALLAVPLVAFSVTYFAAFGLDYDRLNNSQLIARLLPQPTAPTPPAGATPRASTTPPAIARVTPKPGTATAVRTVGPSLALTATAAAVTRLASPLPSMTPRAIATAAPTRSATPTRTATLRPATPLPGSSPPATPPSSGLPDGCVEGRRITSPVTGQVLERGIILVQGSAASEPFQRYKLEVAPGANPAEHGFYVLREAGVPVSGGLLAEWNTATLPPAPYTLRLTVVKPDGNWFEPRCLVTFTLQ